MPSRFMIRLGLPAILGVVLAGAIASAQDRKPLAPPLPAQQRSVPVFNPIEGRIVVISAKPDQTTVQAGEIICELNPADLRIRLARQETIVHAAQSESQACRIAHEAALLALREFKEGTYKQQLASAEGQIKLAESKLSQAEDRVEWAVRMSKKGYASIDERISEELALKHARFALEEAQLQRVILVQFSRDKTIKSLTGAIESARSRELAAQAALDREQSVQKSLTNELGLCQIKAPISGRIEYDAPFGAGAVLHDGQFICRVIADSAAKSNTQ
jgi:HlyD family secretion protein